MKEEHFAQQLKTKDLEHKLAEAKLAQQADFAASESKKALAQAEKITYLTSMVISNTNRWIARCDMHTSIPHVPLSFSLLCTLHSQESNLRAQLSGYAEKFEQVQLTLSKSNELFASFKSEMEKSGAALKKSESAALKLEREKLALEKKSNAAQLQLISMHEARQAEKAELDKAQRQNAVLTSLCKELKAKMAGGAAAAPAPTVEEESKQQIATAETPA